MGSFYLIYGYFFRFEV